MYKMWEKLEQNNTINYCGCGLYYYEKKGSKIILKKHLGHEMEIENYEDLKDFNNLCRVSCWEIQYYNKNIGDWE